MKEFTKLSTDSSALSLWLKQHGYAHLTVKARGESLVVSSAEENGEFPHVRFTRLGADAYAVSIMKHNGKWERTPMIGPIAEAADFTQNIGYLDF